MHSPLLFRETFEVQRVLPLMAAIFVSNVPRGRASGIITVPRPLSRFEMAVLDGKTRYISTITGKNRGL